MLIILLNISGGGAEAQPSKSQNSADISIPPAATKANSELRVADAERPIEREPRTLQRRNGGGKTPILAGKSENYGGWSMTRTVGALAGVVGLIVFLAWGYRSMTSGNIALLGKNRRPGSIEIVSKTALSARQSLYLVRLGSRMVLVGQSADSLRALDVIDDPGVVAQLAGEAAGGAPESKDAEFQACLEHEASGYLKEEAEIDDGIPHEEPRIDEVRQNLSETIQRVRRAVKGGSGVSLVDG